MAIKKVLCIEDDRFIGEMYVRSLLRAGYQVDWQTDGNSGLINAKTNQYDLILLDIMLPERRGTEVLEALRGIKGDVAPDTHIIIMTNFDHDDESRQAMAMRADGYLIKAEITPRKLLDIIKQLDEGSTGSKD